MTDLKQQSGKRSEVGSYDSAVGAGGQQLSVKEESFKGQLLKQESEEQECFNSSLKQLCLGGGQ